MAGTNLKAIQDILNVAKKLRSELDMTKQSIVTISQEAGKAKKNFQFTGPKGVSDELDKNVGVIKKLNVELKKQELANKKLQEQILKLNKVKKTNNKLTIEERENKRLLTQQLRLQHRASDKLASSYSQQSAKLILLRNRYKDLAIKQQMGIKLSAAERKEKDRLIRQVTKLDASLKRVDRTVGQSQRNVGNYRGALRGLGGTLRNLAGAFGLVGGVMIFAQLMRNGIRTIIDYGKANATLSGVLRLQKSEMTELIAESKRLGAITVKTANEVVGLQIAYARLGFSQEQIIQLTEATIEGSIAMNSELAETAELTGAVVNSMDEFSAIDAPEILDILALSTAKSALTFEKLTVSLPKVLGAANALNIPFTKVVATLGKLSDAGVEASIAGTSLRKIFISAARSGIDYEKALDKVRNSTEKLKTADELFGTRAAVAAVLIANNTEKLDLLNEALLRAKGTTKEMADKELDTLAGSLKLLESAWSGVILKENEANGVGDKLKRGLKFLANNLDKVVDFTKKSVKAWLVYKGVLVAIAVSTRLWAAATALAAVKVAFLKGGIKAARIEMQVFNIATKANPLGILITLLAGAVALFVAFGDGATRAARSQRNLNRAIEEGKESAADQKELSDKRIQDEIDAIRKRTREQVAETKSEKEIHLIRKNAIDETVVLLKKEQEAVKKRVVAYSEQTKQYNKDSPIRAKYNILITKESELYDELGDKIKSLTTDIKELRKETPDEIIKGTIKVFQDQIAILKKLQTETATTNEEFNKFEDAIGAVQHKIDLLNGSYEKFLELGDKLKTIDFQDVLDAAPEEIDFGFIDIDENESISDFEKYLDTLERMDKAAREHQSDRIQGTFDRLSELYGIDLGNFRDYLDLKRDDFESNEEFELAKRLQTIEIVENATRASLQLISNIQRQKSNDELARLEDEKNTFLQNKQLSEEQRSIIEAEFEEKRSKLKQKQFKRDQNIAILMANINGATAVVKTFAELGWPAGIAGAAIITALTAIEIGIIKSQKMPAFKDGHLTGTHSGLAMINDEKTKNYQEIVKRKSGRLEVFKKRNQVIDMKLGDKVYKAGTMPSDVANKGIDISSGITGRRLIDSPSGQIIIKSDKSVSKEIKKGFSGLKPHRAESINYSKLARTMYSLNRANKI